MAIETPGDLPAPKPAQPSAVAGGDPSLGELFKELARESSILIRQEMELAKSEFRVNLRDLVKGAARIAIGGALLFVAFLILNAFLIVLIGDGLDNYWLGALILGVLYLVVGGALTLSGRKGLQRGDMKPSETLNTLREDSAWAQNEAREMKRELTS